MNSQNTRQSTNNIQNELSEDLKNSEVSVVSKNNDVVGDDSQEELQTSIGPKTNEFDDTVSKQEIKDLTGVIQSKKLAEEVCWYNQQGIRVCRP